MDSDGVWEFFFVLESTAIYSVLIGVRGMVSERARRRLYINSTSRLLCFARKPACVNYDHGCRSIPKQTKRIVSPEPTNETYKMTCPVSKPNAVA